MGTFSTGGLGGLIERGIAGRAGDIGGGIVNAREAGWRGFGYGGELTEEGLTGLRGLRGQYQDRLKDPLGENGRGIFARARGNLSDDFARTVNSGVARRRQLAVQSGGSLTAEQMAALDAGERRDASEGLFKGENDLSIAETEMTLGETNKLFDRMEGIDKTVTGVGQDEKTRGLQTMLSALTLGLERNKAISQEARAWVSMFKPGGGGGVLG
jgi:hypothetical protein